MKEFFLLLAMCVTFFCNAQQKEPDSLLNELKKHPQEDTVKLNLLNSIAFKYSDINPDKGLQTADQAIALAKKLNNKEKLAAAILNKGLIYNSKGEDSLALNFYMQALNICRQHRLTSLSAKVCNYIGVVYCNTSDYFKALEYQKKALQIAAASHDSLGMARALVSTGVIYQYLPDYPEALAYQQKALAIYNKLNYENGVANVYTNMGIIYLNLNNYSKALNYHEQAFKLNEQSGNQQAMANALSNMGTAYDNLNDSANAAACYQKALIISNKAGYKFGIASSTGNLGILYYFWYDYVKALYYLNKAIPLYRDMNDKINQSLLLRYIGSVYAEAPEKMLSQLGIHAANRYAEANKYLQQSLAIAKEIKALDRQAYTLASLSELYENQKDYKSALAYYKQADVIGDSVINDSKKQQVTRLEMQYQFDKTQDSIKAVNDKKQALATAEIQKQRIVKNATMAGAAFLILAGIGGFVFYKRNRDIRTKQQQAELKQQITDVEMKALRAQMNPHFIFNSLNSIADYIDKNQTKIAADFTTKFAKLMRMVLENSEQKEIPLADDLKALELYMQLESLRLKNKFSYEIIVDKALDKENTLVPPLILQPFVENSIWHGVAKQEHGNITINILKDDGMIHCIVDDNGSGISNAEFVNREKKSLGMRITKARIDIINKIKNANASMNIYNKERGVRAEVKLPLEMSF